MVLLCTWYPGIIPYKVKYCAINFACNFLAMADSDQDLRDVPGSTGEPMTPAWVARLSAASDYVATIQYLQSRAPRKSCYFL